MKTIVTEPGGNYTVTVTQAATITGITNAGIELVLASASNAGQLSFQAISMTTHVSDDAAVVLPLHDPAEIPDGLTAEQVGKMVNSAVEETTVTPFVEAAYEWIKPIHWAQIDGSTVGSGVVSRVEIPCLTRAEEPELSTGELFLELYEADEAGNFVLLGVSRNAVRQQAGQVSRWVFSDVAVHGRPIRLSPTRHAGGGWDDSLVLGAGGRQRYGQEDSFVEMAAGGRSAVMLAVTISTVTREAKFAPAEHATDEVRHITAAERESWNAKANASALAGKVNTATFNAHANDAVKHVTAAERATWNGMLPLSGGQVNGTIEIYDSGYDRGVRLGGDSVQWYSSTDAGYGIPWDVFIAHPDTDEKHVTAAERARWESAASGTLAANSTIADGGTGLASLNLHSDNAATLHVQRMEAGNTRNAIALSVNNQLSKLDVWGAAAGIEVSNKAAPGETPTARCRITATSSSPGLKLDDMPLVMTIGGTTLTLGEAELQALAALIARKDELLALLQPTQ